jgi:lipopolysaccharide export system protein LptC
MSPVTRERMLDGLRRRNPELLAAIARRSMTVGVVKKILPLAAVALLVALAAIPGLRAGPDGNRVTYRVQHMPDGSTASRMQDASYHGVDAQGEPFTLTANAADEHGNDIALKSPEGDISLKSGAWLMLKSQHGLYHQKDQQLGLTGDVTLYRNDGTTMKSATAQIDLQKGNAASTAPVQVQGPFGTLEAANGFTLSNRGTEITFNGPATLTLTQAQ